MQLRKAIILLLLSVMPLSAADVLLEVFTFAEPVGVTNRMQVWNAPFAFTTSSWSSVYLIKSNTLVNTELAYQPASTGGVFIADFVPPNTTNVYRLYSGHASTATPLISITTNAAYYEVTNSLLGARILRSGAALALQRSPLQGIRLYDGTWGSTNETTTSKGPWLYDYGTDTTMDVRNTNRLTATNLITTVIESGPVLFQVRNAYEYTRAAYSYGAVGSYSAGYGAFTNYLTVSAETPRIDFDDETNMELWHGVHIQELMSPDRARWKGHGATQAAYGYKEDTGTRYIQPNTGSNYWATRNLNTGEDVVPIPQGGDTDGPPKRLSRMVPWNQFGDNGGWVWQVFSSAGASTTPVIGAGVGAASRAGGLHASGVSYYSKASTRWGFSAEYAHRGENNVFDSGLKKMQWFVYIGRKSELPAFTAFHPIEQYGNLLKGINLTKQARWTTTFSGGPYNRMFMSFTDFTNNFMAPLRTSLATYNYYKAAEEYGHGAGIYDYIRENANGSWHTNAAFTNLDTARALLDDLMHGDGVNSHPNGGMSGGQKMTARLALVDLVLGDQWATDEQKRISRIGATAMGYLLWDNDWFPIDISGFNGIGPGTPNQLIQAKSSRDLFALEMQEHSFFSTKVAYVTNDLVEVTDDFLHDYGGGAETPHYINAAAMPIMQACLLAKRTTSFDPFAARLSKWTNFARSYMQMITMEARFATNSGMRKRVTWGDGPVEGAAIPGILAQGLVDLHPAVAAELMAVWHGMNKPHDGGTFMSTSTMINEGMSTNMPTLTHGNFPGVFSVLRSAYATTNETVVLMPNGTWYNDHRHQQDWGSLHIYVFGAPLAIAGSSFYTPRTPQAYMQNAVIPETLFASPWNGGQPVFDTTQTTGGFTSDATNRNFISFASSGWMDGHLTDASARWWNRDVRLIAANPELPVIVVRDTFSENNRSRVMTLQVASENNAITTPAGSYSVTVQDYPSHPPGGTIQTVTNGVREFVFTGGTWAGHPSSGINWKQAINTSENKFASAGAWGTFAQNSREQIQYRTANGVSTYRERLTQFRIRGSNDFNQIIVPYRKNAYVAGLTISTNGPDFQISNTNQYWRVSTNEWAYNVSTNRRVLAVWSGLTGSDTNGIAITGGPAEVDLRLTNTIFAIHGAAGKRTFTLPANYP
jgi:hypothetical protein